MASIVNKTEEWVRTLLKEQLKPDHCYHNLAHTQAVVESTRLLAARLEVSSKKSELLEVAAWFHDTGFVNTYEDHEREGQIIARDFLLPLNVPEEDIATIERLIMATKVGHQPIDLLEKIIRDADLSNLGRADYLAVLSGLRHEWEIFRNEFHKDRAWYKLNYTFVANYQYHTDLAKEIYGVQRQQNLRILKRLAQKKAKKNTDKPKKINDRTGDTIATNRSAQMMFKTSLRNHIDLSSLADNKANIMLSVNALIITIAVPMATNYINDAPHLMASVIILLLTSLCSMIFATLATRPIPMSGLTTIEDIKAGRSNLFFFGNFYRMNLNDYEAGMEEVIKNDENLEAAIKRDLFFLGSSLGKKYNQLRICYNLFMVGVVISVLLFGISYAIFQ